MGDEVRESVMIDCLSWWFRALIASVLARGYTKHYMYMYRLPSNGPQLVG